MPLIKTQYGPEMMKMPRIIPGGGVRQYYIENLRRYCDSFRPVEKMEVERKLLIRILDELLDRRKKDGSSNSVVEGTWRASNQS